MGKSTISMAIFNSYVSHNQRVKTHGFAPEFSLHRQELSGFTNLAGRIHSGHDGHQRQQREGADVGPAMILDYPLVMTNIAIENDHRHSVFSHEKW